ncbi:MAG: carbohydrate kinase family protein [Thiohalomonadales bacterium]
MAALICGSYAYDTIMVFNDKFKHHILPDKVHMLNVSFLVPEMRREFGGCAGNITFNLQLLGGKPIPMATVGHDFVHYAEWMKKHNINRDHIKVIQSEFTGQAFITTDLDDNQITAFHPGAMNHAHDNNVADASDVEIGIVSPDGRDGMIQHASQFAAADIPFIFDPGQGLPMFNGDDLQNFIQQASWVTVNDYEAALIVERTGESIETLAKKVEAFIVTKGREGSQIYTHGDIIDIPSATAEQVKDPTGCGDAYRAGILYGLMNQLDWPSTGRIASLMGAIKVAHHGTQNHQFDREQFAIRYQASFNQPFPN